MLLRSFLLLSLRIIPLFWVIFILNFDLNVHVLTTISLVMIGVLFLVFRFDLTNAWIAFSLPWFLILIFGTLGISEYSRDVEARTVAIIVALIALAAALISPKQIEVVAPGMPREAVRKRRFRGLLILFFSLAFLNVAFAGYVPLISLVTTGDSGYMTFGVKGVYGIFNAFANAFGVTAFYLWMTEGGTLYRNTFFSILFVFLLFVTRQNIISLLVESFVVYNIVRRRISIIRIAVIVVITLFLFGVVGDLRVGADISEVAKIKDEFKWIPTAGIWLYSYFYFNLLNLDNAVNVAGGAAFDLSSFAQLLPSFLRPEAQDGESLLEVSSFTVGSFVSPIYRDIGLFGLLFVFTIFCLALTRYRNRLRGDFNFVAITGYAVLYFCFMFSFFENFWFYLPIIFQLVFLSLFGSYIFTKQSSETL